MSPSMAQHDIFRDQLAIKYPTYGHALWEPNPGGLYHAIEVGDVGCILKGKFLRLFNILLPADHPSHQKSGVPESHEPLKPSIVDHIDSGTPGPEIFCSVGVTESAALANSQTSVLDPEGHVETSFSCTKSRGAALFLPVRAQREDTVARGDFAEWMVQHVDSWFSFANTLDLGIESIRMEDIVLVTGHHRTRSWTNVAFTESQGLVQRQVAFGVHVSGTPPSHISVNWKSPRGLGQGVASNMGPSGEDLSENQCVFIRGFRVTHTRQVLNWFRDTARSTSGLNENRDKPARQQTSQSTPTVTYRDPLSSLLEYIASRDPHSDMVLVHDDDLARFHEISDVSSLETLQRDVVLARLRDVQPKIQQVFSGSPSANNGRRVAMFSKEQAKIPSDESATPTSSIGRNLSRLTFFSKAPRKNLSSASNSSQPALRHGTRRARHNAGSSMNAPVRLSAYMADMEYAPTHSFLDIRLEAPNAGTTQNDAEKSTERPDQSRESPFTRWIPTLLAITQDVEQFAQGSLEEIARLGQDPEREPSNLILRRSEVRLLMCCASLPPAEFASTKGHSQPSAAQPYYPTGDPEQDKKKAFTMAMECCEVLKDLHSGNDAASIATKYFELSQALSDLGLLHYASITSGFALETFRALHTTAPDNFGLSVTSVLSLRANILADLGQDEEAVNAADGAIALCQHQRADPVPELVYALLKCAVLLCSVGRKQRGAAVALELVGLLGDANGSRLDTMHISSLCHLCRSDAHVGVNDALALSTAEEAIEISRNSSGIGPQAVLAGALFTKSKVLSSQNQHHLAHVASAEAVSLLRGISAQRHVFSLILGHVLDTRSRQLLSANQIADSYSVAKEAVELWRALLMSAPGPIRRPLGWALVHQAKFRDRRSRRKAIREELGHAEFAVMLFRLVTPLDGAGLASALYLVADRMRELDERRAAAALVEEAVTRLQELSSEVPDVYSLDLIFSLSLASSCLSRTERASDALKYAKDAVEEQREREEAADVQYSTHLRQLLRDVILRFTEMGRQEEARPWVEEMQSLGHSGEIGELTTACRSSALSGGHGDGEIRKETIYWIDSTSGTSSLSQE